MSPQTVVNYEEIVRRSGLVSRERLEAVLTSLRREWGDVRVEGETLARRLEEESLLTAWQNHKLRQGCCRGYFLGRYKLLSFLGAGGMSTVYLAEHTLMKRRVAIKVLHPKLTEKSSYLERFYLESQVTAQLDHGNIVRAYDVGFEDNHHYLVMEFVDGPTLREQVEKNGPLPVEQAADYIRQSAEGLFHAHEAGLIHRDVKPSNLMITPKGVVKVVDLGMVLCNQIESLTLKHNETMLGTADYLSPEQAVDSHEVDSRSDIYSLGCTLYFALTGRPPFVEGSLASRLMQHQTEEPQSIQELRPDVPTEIVQICQKMMAKQVRKRYQTCLQASRALAQWIEEQHPERNSLVFAEAPSAADDTVNDVSRNTLIGKNAPGEKTSDASTDDAGKAEIVPVPGAEEKITVQCPHCETALKAKLKAHPFRAKCPRCKSVMLVHGRVAALVDSAVEASVSSGRAGFDSSASSGSGSSLFDMDGLRDAIASVRAAQAAAAGVVPVSSPSPNYGPPSSAASNAASAQSTPRPAPRNRPAEVADWKYAEFISALEDGDLRLADAVHSLCSQYPHSQKVADVLLRLLNHIERFEDQGDASTHTIDVRLIRAVITAMGSNLSERATLSLGRVVVGAVRFRHSERPAVESAIAAMASYPTPERDAFLIDALAHAETARPTGRGDYTSGELRAAVASVFLKHASPTVRAHLHDKLSSSPLVDEARTLIQRVLKQ